MKCLTFVQYAVSAFRVVSKMTKEIFIAVTVASEPLCPIAIVAGNLWKVGLKHPLGSIAANGAFKVATLNVQFAGSQWRNGFLQKMAANFVAARVSSRHYLNVLFVGNQ